MAMPQIKTFPVQISGGYQAHVRLHLPPGLREDEITRYVCMCVYAVCLFSGGFSNESVTPPLSITDN